MKKPNIFYGYWIVAVGFLCLFVVSGGGLYSFSLFYTPLQAEFNWSRGTISTAITISFIIQGVAAPFFGRVVDRYGARNIIPLGALITGLGFLWLSLMQNLWSYYAGYAVMGLGLTAMGFIPTTQLVSNWFTKRRGTAVGIMSTGIGIGGLTISLLIGAYIIPGFGWRASYLTMAILTWVLIIPASLLVIRAKPADMGLYPDGAEITEDTAEVDLSPQASEDWTLKMALKTLTFWLIVIAFITTQISFVGILLHQVNYLTDIGFPVVMAATALGGVGFFSSIGKFAFGWLCDRMAIRYATAISFALQLAAVVVLITLKATSPVAMIWLYALLMGLGIGGWVPTLSMLISSNYGLASYGAIFGMLTLAVMFSSATGPLMAGLMFDAMQTYYWVFIVFLVLYTMSIPSILAARRPKLPSAYSG